MLLQIPAVLTAEQVTHCRTRLDQADWRDGRITAGPQSARVKANEQLPDHDGTARELGDLVTRALERSPQFIAAALPRHVFPPLFNRYVPGMSFGAHVDNAIRQVPGTSHRLRTDISATLFLSAPEDYDGGELVVEDTYGTHSVKLAAGDMVLYPATSLHQVLPVTRGARVAAFFWIQSMVRDDGERGLLFDLDLGIREIVQADPEAPAAVRLTACYHNLLRRWAEL
jgi:PKHD-type hydroxylase